MRASRVLSAALLLAVSCHQYRTDPASAPTSPPASAESRTARAPLPEWVPAPTDKVRDPLAPTPGEPDGGALVDGQRISKAGVAASQIAAPALFAGTRIPKHLGGGFLFWSAKALYFAPTFVASLEPVVALDVQVNRVSFGSGYALVHQSNGARFVVSLPSKKLGVLPVAGLVDAGALADGRSLFLIEPGLVLTLGAGQKTWRDMTAATAPISSLLGAGDALWLLHDGGAASRLEPDGSLSRHASLPEELRLTRPKLDDPRWPASMAELPLTRAVRRGVPIDEHTAVVEVAGAFARVDLASGSVSSVSPAVLPRAESCELLPVEGDVLALCQAAGMPVVVSGVKGPAPKIERSFSRSGQFFAGSLGTLLFRGPCEERKTEEPVVCVRQRDGSWRELGETAKAGAARDGGAPARQLSILRWVPTRDGGALGLVGGTDGGLYNPATGELARFTNEQYRSHGGLFSTSSGPVGDEFAIAENGSIVGYWGQSSFVLHTDGRVESSPHRYHSLASSGALGVASDGENRLWQSNDYGRHWVEISRPPGTDLRPGVGPTQCSRVGCELRGWYRLGYRKSEPRPFRLAVAPNPVLSPKRKAPRLVCERTSPPRTRWVTRAVNTDGALIEEFDFGARKVAARQDELITLNLVFDGDADEHALGGTLFERGLEDAQNPGFGRLLARNRTLRFVDPLGDPKIVEARFSWQDVLTRAGQSGEAPSGVSGERPQVVPVLAEKPGQTAGVLVRDATGVLLWARAGQAARVTTLGLENAGFHPVSATLKGKEELQVLAQDDACAARVISLTGAGARTLLELPQRASVTRCPAHQDALGTLDDGSVAVLRAPSADAPSAEDPALVLRPGQKPVSLAAWSGLKACAADASGWRALVLSNAERIELVAPGLQSGSFSFAVVRWSEQGVCAETVGVGAPAIDIRGQELGTLAIARLGAAPRADRRGFAQGAEHTEDLTCQLVGPR